jgi:cyclopropane-fatty-acyl-phospholipid synthase
MIPDPKMQGNDMGALFRRFLTRIVTRGTLEIESASGRHFTVGSGAGDPVAVRFTDQAAERRLLLDPALALGELHMEGRMIVTRGSIYDLLALVASNLSWQTPPGLARAHDRIRRTLRPFQQRNTKRRAVRNVGHHYDLDGRLYDLFLDADRQYSCAHFEHADQALEDAQLAKKRHIAAKLLLEEGHRVLDIGCGWGGLAIYLAQQCHACVTGITLSEEQLAVARGRAEKSGIPHIDFHLQDYRAVTEQFDRVVSVGMFEHVGVAYYDTYFAKAADLLAEDGVMLLHSIGRMDGPGTASPWIDKYIFPGSYAPALSEVLPAIERAGLIVTDIEILRLHYAETLRAWRERFLTRRDEAKLLYDERFCRMWEFYLAASEAAFRFSGLMVFQIQLAKSLEAVPLTRDYIAMREAELRLKDNPNPHLMAAE